MDDMFMKPIITTYTTPFCVARLANKMSNNLSLSESLGKTRTFHLELVNNNSRNFFILINLSRKPNFCMFQMFWRVKLFVLHNFIYNCSGAAYNSLQQTCPFEKCARSINFRNYLCKYKYKRIQTELWFYSATWMKLK